MEYYCSTTESLWISASLNKIFLITGEIPRGFRFHCQAASKYKGVG